jgi:5'-nucleotidase
VAKGKVSVTPLHFDLTDHEGLSSLARHDLERLLTPPTEQVEQ